MDRKICLDTDVCIEIINGNEDIKNKLLKFSSSLLYISSISVFELFLREFNIDKIEEFVLDTEVVSFDEITARRSSKILKNLKNSGRLLDFRDVFIAASCLENECSLLTLNRKHFERIEGLELLELK